MPCIPIYDIERAKTRQSSNAQAMNGIVKIDAFPQPQSKVIRSRSYRLVVDDWSDFSTAPCERDPKAMQRRRLRATLTKIPTEIARHIFCQEGRTVVMSILTLTQQNLATRTIDHSMTWNPSLQTMLLEGILLRWILL